MWKTQKLSDVIEKGETINPTTNPDTKFSYIDVSSVDRVSFRISKTQTLLGKDAPSRARRAVRTGDVLFATIRPTLQRVAIVPENLNGEVCSTGYIVLRPKASIICSKFIFYYMLSEKVKAEMEGLQTGASYPAVNDTQVKNLHISYPPLAEQQRIVAKLDAAFVEIDKAIEIARQQASQSSSVLEQITEETFKGVEGELVTLNDACHLITCGVAARPNYVDDGIPFLSAQNVKRGQVIYSNHKHITQAKHQELTKKNKPLCGDLLYTRVGSYGEAAVIERDIEFSIFVSLTLIKTKDALNPYYLKYYLNSRRLKVLASKSLSGSGVGNLNVGSVRKFPITLPSLQKQAEIVRFLDNLADNVRELSSIHERKASELLSLKSAIFAQELQPSEAA
jgi:type I restriction enzyme S subunit